ncbi:MAG TPA: GNAT family N-acetyltransferase [Capsulimonadaceae bacterium]|nr:GNAT family N-acetyltransferase [Capsulimonadaceae bacterium]
MPITLQIATSNDVAEIVVLRNATSEALTSRYGDGHWSVGSSERGVLFAMKTARLYIARDRGRLIALLALSPKKPWAVDKSYFHASTKPLYLTNMAVAPDVQRTGIGRRCIEEARRIARDWPGDAIRLDAYDAEAGAGGFYAKCGFKEVGRASYRNTPLIYYEMLL